MNLRRIGILALGGACASEGSDYGMGRGPSSPVGAAGSASGRPIEPAEPGPPTGGGTGAAVVLALSGNIQGAWSYVWARALEKGDGFLLRLYAEPLSRTSDFVPTHNYARLTLPALGAFEAEGAGRSSGGALAEFIVCAKPGSPCVGAAVTSVLATGQIRLQRNGSGLLGGNVELRAGNDFIAGDFDGVESYAAVCAAKDCRCNGRQLEHCSWDTSTWRAASCSELAGCPAAGLLNRCCGVVQP